RDAGGGVQLGAAEGGAVGDVRRVAPGNRRGRLGDGEGLGDIRGGVVVGVACLVGGDRAAAGAGDVDRAAGDRAVAGGGEADRQPRGGGGAHREVRVAISLVRQRPESNRLVRLVYCLRERATADVEISRRIVLGRNGVTRHGESRG